MQKQRHFHSVNRRSEWEREGQATVLLKMKEKNVITISENETKKNLSVTRLIRVTLFSELTLETVIKNYQIKTTEM